MYRRTHRTFVYHYTCIVYFRHHLWRSAASCRALIQLLKAVLIPDRWLQIFCFQILNRPGWRSIAPHPIHTTIFCKSFASCQPKALHSKNLLREVTWLNFVSNFFCRFAAKFEKIPSTTLYPTLSSASNGDGLNPFRCIQTLGPKFQLGSVQHKMRNNLQFKISLKWMIF